MNGAFDLRTDTQQTIRPVFRGSLKFTKRVIIISDK